MITKGEESASANELRHLSKLKQLEFCQKPTRTEEAQRQTMKYVFEQMVQKKAQENTNSLNLQASSLHLSFNQI